MALVVVFRPVSVAVSQQMALVVVFRLVSVAVRQEMARVVVSRPVSVAVSQQMALVVESRPVSVAVSKQMALVVVSRPVSVVVSQQMALVGVSKPVSVLEVLVQRRHSTSGPSRDSWFMLFLSGNFACDAALFTAARRFQTSDDHQNYLRSLLTTGTSIEHSSTVEVAPSRFEKPLRRQMVGRVERRGLQETRQLT